MLLFLELLNLRINDVRQDVISLRGLRPFVFCSALLYN